MAASGRAGKLVQWVGGGRNEARRGSAWVGGCILVAVAYARILFSPLLTRKICTRKMTGRDPRRPIGSVEPCPKIREKMFLYFKETSGTTPLWDSICMAAFFLGGGGGGGVQLGLSFFSDKISDSEPKSKISNYQIK